MARLNDVTAPSESVEALKRRFVRQNREIARVNSMQSLRIRSLESEVSHLLAENVSLREQVINLTQETERLEAAKALHEGVHKLKSRLDAHVEEACQLVRELEKLPQIAAKLNGAKLEVESDRPKMTASDLRASMAHPEYAAEVDDGRLPPILEDKYYPRRTLESYEIQTLGQTDPSLPTSPPSRLMRDLEFEHTEDTSTPVVGISSVQHGDTSVKSELVLPPTLETRKKKNRRSELTTPSLETGSPLAQLSPSEESGRLLKFGSKRKFSPDDDGLLSDRDQEDDEFQFIRSNRHTEKQILPFQLDKQSSTPSKAPMELQQLPAKLEPEKRKVLKPKSANTNLGSPRKMQTAFDSDMQHIDRDENCILTQKPKKIEHISSKSLSQTQKRPDRGSQKEKRSSRSSESNETLHSQAQGTSSKGSPVVHSEESLQDYSEGTTASRSSRRRAAVVSYAEPNLRNKMRRPTNDLIDAVEKHGSRRSSSYHLAQDGVSDEGDQSRGKDSGNSLQSTSTRALPADMTLADQYADRISSGSDANQPFTAVPRRKRKVSSNSQDEDVMLETSALTDSSSKTFGETVGLRRQSRRHSSNPRSTINSGSGEDAKTSREPQLLRRKKAPAVQAEEAFDQDEVAGHKSPSTVDARYRSGSGLAARRRSMMV